MMDYFLLLALAALAGAFSLWCPCGYSIAETVTHTVSGWRRFRVRVLLLTATTFSAAVFGFAMGLLGSIADVGRFSGAAIAAVAVIALIADEGGRRWRPLKPLAVGRQVPREWGIVFPAETVSVLYGLRLGIAPLTILASWVWWVTIIASAFYGPWFSALVGATFAITRIVVSEVSTSRTTTNTMAARMSKVFAVEKPLRAAGALALVAVFAVSVVSDDTVNTNTNEEQIAQR
jgi:hypothetical protein